MSSNPAKWLLVAAARPNFMKVAPIIWELMSRSAGTLTRSPIYRLVHTGQHYDPLMSDVFFDELRIPPPDVNLGVGSGSHAHQTALVMTRFEQVCLEERPDWIIVVGDVNSTMACTLVSAKLGIKVAHVEAGLRSFDRSMPEEVNRVVTDALADLLLTPSEDANENLTREGVPTSRIRLVGNVMIDSLIANLEKARASALIGQLGLQQSGFVFVTLHRPSNVDDQHVLRALMHELRRISERIPIVFPIHPRTREKCERFDISLHEDARFRVIDPIGYHDSLCLTEAARIVLTDSGGLQEESTYFRTPCLTVRPNTERPVTLTVGSNALTDLHMLSSDVDDCLRGNRHRGSVPGLWDGRAAGRIVDCIVAAS